MCLKLADFTKRDQPLATPALSPPSPPVPADLQHAAEDVCCAEDKTPSPCSLMFLLQAQSKATRSQELIQLDQA